jgi:C-terminal processing protease CtpA/Prc
MLTAGGKGELAHEESGHGVFTKYVLEALDGAADRDEKGFITFSDMASYVKPKVSRYTATKQIPQYGSIDGEGEFVFVLAGLPAAVQPDPSGLEKERKHLAEEKERLEAERRNLATQQAQMEEQKRLAEEQRRLEEEKKRIAEEQASLRAEKEALEKRQAEAVRKTAQQKSEKKDPFSDGPFKDDVFFQKFFGKEPNQKITQLKLTKKTKIRAGIGISVQDVTEDIAKTLKLKEKSGSMISEVFKGDSADEAGLQPMDVVIEVNGTKIKDSHQLLIIIASFHVGEKVNIIVLRDSQEKTFQVTVAERKDKINVAVEKGGWIDRFGMTAKDITPRIAGQIDTPRIKGVIVTDVEGGSPADIAGIQLRDIILQINKVNIVSMADYKREIAKSAAKNSFLFLIKRGKKTYYIALRLKKPG